jgi:hypothetical protein
MSKSIFSTDRKWAEFERRKWVQMDRQQCIQWIAENYPGHVPPKSSCIGCPYHSDNEWRALTEAEFTDACLVDEALRNAKGLKYPAFLHRSCVPLAEVDFTDYQLRLPFGEVQKHSMIITGLEDEL